MNLNKKTKLEKIEEEEKEKEKAGGIMIIIGKTHLHALKVRTVLTYTDLIMTLKLFQKNLATCHDLPLTFVTKPYKKIMILLLNPMDYLYVTKVILLQSVKLRDIDKFLIPFHIFFSFKDIHLITMPFVLRIINIFTLKSINIDMSTKHDMSLCLEHHNT